MIGKNKGFTLIELIIAMALLSIIIALSFSVLNFSGKAFKVSTEEYELQSSMRLAVEEVNNIVRYSTALFTVPESSFEEDNLTAGWDYFGVRNVKVNDNPKVIESEIVIYKYDGDMDTHIPQVIVPAKENITYDLFFDKTSPHDKDKLLKFIIEASIKKKNSGDEGAKKITIESKTEALNALQVVDRGTDLSMATAIAYRSDDRPDSIVGHIAMVLDTSGSMNLNLQGYSASEEKKKRINILKKEAKELITSFAKEANVDISLVPFATSANKPKSFKNAQSKVEELTNDIDGLEAEGGTNTGDGLRRAYYQLKSHNEELIEGTTANNYIIVLVDGETTFYSARRGSGRSLYYITRDGDIYESTQVYGNGSSLDQKGVDYVNKIGSMIKTNNFAKVFVIGFSSGAGDVNYIATACGASSEHVYQAGSPEELNKVFSTIRQEIINDLWHLMGPKL
ncbi:VWA domain-containing protein [Dethiothermospora halolimnae]|uniref:VWA domain-containing protein n=1 Tax=Dethiothermospora halolimnae TaxID=3114390 RepID=UPI003CCC35FE